MHVIEIEPLLRSFSIKNLEGNFIILLRDGSTGSLEKVGVMRSICIMGTWESLSLIALAAAGASSKPEAGGFFFPLVHFSSRPVEM